MRALTNSNKKLLPISIIIQTSTWFQLTENIKGNKTIHEYESVEKNSKKN